MDISVLTDTVKVVSTQGLSFTKFLLRHHYFGSNNHLSLFDSSSEQSSSSGGLQVSAAISPVDVVASPPVRSNSYKIARRNLIRKKRRTRRRSLTGGSEDGEDVGFFGDGGDGPFGGDSGGDGRGWNFGGFGGGHNWDESSSSDPAYDFVYEVICWIALSNCVHFAFNKVVRIVADGIGDAERQKVSFRLTSMC